MVAHSTLEATSVLLPVFLNLVRDVFSITVLLWSVLLLWYSYQLYPILEGTLLASVLAVVLAGVLVSVLELGGDDIHTDELLPPYIRVFPKILMVCHTAAEGTCELVDNDIDQCPIRYFGVGLQSNNFIKIILDLCKWVVWEVLSKGQLLPHEVILRGYY